MTFLNLPCISSTIVLVTLSLFTLTSSISNSCTDLTNANKYNTIQYNYHSLWLQLRLSVPCNKHRKATDLETVKSYDRALSIDTIKKDNFAFYPLTSQSVLYVHILIFTLNEEAFINHFLKCSRTVCANNARHSDHYVIRFITRPLHLPSHQLNNHLAVSIYLPATVSQLLPDFEFPLI